MKKIIYPAIAATMAITSCITAPSAQQQLARQILADTTLTHVEKMAHATIRNGFNAGSGYSQIWARDMNTFVEVACEEKNPAELRQAILLFFALQQPNDEMIDGYVVKEDFTWGDKNPYYSEAAPKHVAFKNTVETDQETSLMQIVYKYIQKTGDKSILEAEVAGKTVLQRMDAMIDYLMRERYDADHGLIYGAMTADWGDVQPNDPGDPVDINDLSVMAIDVYDNAMLIIALDGLLKVAPDYGGSARWKQIRAGIYNKVREHLWDDKNQKFIPHIYLDKRPDLGDFDENKVFYHGGTAVAIEAGLLTIEEIRAVNDQMVRNVKASGMPSIGLTLYPAYPKGFFCGGMANTYTYQNGGDWTWFGGRMIQQLVRNGMAKEAYEEIRPMVDRVIENGDFYEWYAQGCKPSGSAHFKGSAGVLAKAIKMLRAWAEENK